MAIVSRELAQAAHAEISRWPEYAVTPLRSLQRVARELGIQELLYKDESARLGQGSFKSLGGAYAATVQLRETGAKPEHTTLCCATDGNHGRSVAYAAQRLGCACVVFMHKGAPDEKARAIEASGARVVRTPGTYDDAVRSARLSAAENRWVLIADTSDDAKDPAARRVLQGYGVMVLEILEQRANAAPFTHVFLQGGVGGLAAAVAGVFAQVYGEHRPKVIVVEPETAGCLFESALRGAPSVVGGDLVTAMAMLSCGEASPVAWPVLQRRADVFMTIEDEAAVETARRLSVPLPAGEGLDVGISGAAGVAGLLQLHKHAEFAAALGLNGAARVLAIGTEEELRDP
jgi:diaminopropionate ammonia-lyase